VNTKTVQLYIAMSLFICIKHEPGLKQGYMLESSMNQDWSKATCWNQAWTRPEARLHVGIKHEPGLKQGYMLESSMNQGWSKATCWKN